MLTYFDKCTHAQVVEALTNERIDWQTLSCAGWPQLAYDELKKLKPRPASMPIRSFNQ